MTKIDLKKYNENKIQIKINNLLAHGGGAIDQLSKIIP